ncbi:Protein lethal(2)k10201 [Harpegnathos saltator]|uniref:Protein lethal(2)k10201 n=2 Tax=Harpegnathos saltator TaxID=610380 RepID=E2BH47_HARSA|nr:Protein lethal(2)k10201 [Harpegnathos saltator]
MYQCYDSECNIKFNTPVERREHCIQVHKFPKKYRFDDNLFYNKEGKLDEMEIDDADKSQKTAKVILNKNQKSKMFTKATNSKICVNTANIRTIPSSDVEPKLTSSLAFIPRQVQRSFSKALTNNQSGERNVLESDNMMELADSLPN